MKKISIVMGTLNRVHLIPGLIENTVNSCENLELVISDGGSTDGTLEYIKSLNHPRIKLIEIGHQSPCPHFINLAISASSHEWILQWTDDAYMINRWEEVMDQLDESDFYLFTWKYGLKDDLNNSEWLKCENRTGWNCNGWRLFLKQYGEGDIVVNWGIFRKQIFRDIGLFCEEYEFWCSDGDMTERAFAFGYKPKVCENIKVLVFPESPARNCWMEDKVIYQKNRSLYTQRILPQGLKYLE